MTTPTRQQAYTQGSGTSSIDHPICSSVSPSSTNTNYPLGQVWINEVANIVYQLTSFSTMGGILSANWSTLGSASGSFVSLTTEDSTVVTPTVGTIIVTGTANQIDTTGSNSPGTVTIGLPDTVVAPGSLASTTSMTVGDALTVTTGGITVSAGGAGITGNSSITGSLTASTTLTATLGAITATNGNLVLGTAGNKLAITTGANASCGQSGAMTAGTITIATTAVTASSLIFLTNAGPAGTVGTLSVGTITAATSFVINSSSDIDTSVVNWLIIN